MARMPDLVYYDMESKPMGMLEWAAKREKDPEFFRVARSALPGGYEVSTVLLGIDHSFGGGPPVIFESLVFPPGGFESLDCDRYSTKAQAIAGHVNMVKKWRRALAELKPKDTVGPMKGVRRPRIIKD